MITSTTADKRLNAQEELTLIEYLQKLGFRAEQILQAIKELKK